MKKECGEPFFADNYLYKKMFLKARSAEAKGGGLLNLNDEYLEIIAGYLGYKSYAHFLELQHYKFPDELENCKGVWCSYVRCNSGDADVLVAPVHIYHKTKQMFIEMKGASRRFKGELKMEGKCLFCLLESGEDKNIHLVLRIGLAKKPNVLQGVFSGISSGGDPIAGREVLIRNDSAFEKLKHRKMKISDLLISGNEEEKLIGEYFSAKQQNIIKGAPASTFELNDLKIK